jgi:succinate dehydrogenase / fumarate reductase flavoprotein subunit
MCKEAPAAVIELEHYGVPFSRTADGRIYQRPFGGMTTNYGKGTRTARAPRLTAPVTRCCTRFISSRSRTTPNSSSSTFALDLIMQDGACRGVVALDLATGKLHRYRAHTVILATGGYGRAISRARQRTPAPVTAAEWRCALACRCRTWNSCSSIRPAFTDRAA